MNNKNNDYTIVCKVVFDDDTIQKIELYGKDTEEKNKIFNLLFGCGKGIKSIERVE